MKQAPLDPDLLEVAARTLHDVSVGAGADDTRAYLPWEQLSDQAKQQWLERAEAAIRPYLIAHMEQLVDYLTRIKNEWKPFEVDGKGYNPPTDAKDAPLWAGTNALLQTISWLTGKDMGQVVNESQARYKQQVAERVAP